MRPPFFLLHNNPEGLVGVLHQAMAAVQLCQGNLRIGNRSESRDTRKLS